MVRLLWILVILPLTSISCTHPKATSEGPVSLSEDGLLTNELDIKMVKPDVFLVEHRFPWAANSLIVKVSPELVVWVDTPYNDDATTLVLRWIRKTYGEVRIVEINTGYHVDNLGGNGALLREGIPVYGATLSARLLAEKGETTRELLLGWLKGPDNATYHEAHRTASYVPSDNLFDIGVDEAVTPIVPSVEVFYPGPSHTEDNLVVYFKNHRVLFGGCMLKAKDAENLGFTGDADLDAWPVSVRRVVARYPDADIVVPGHGAAGDGNLPQHTLSLLESVAAAHP